MAKITRMASLEGDWEAMYIDGTLVVEGHTLDMYWIVTNLIGVTVESYDSFSVDMSEDGYARESLSDYSDVELEQS